MGAAIKTERKKTKEKPMEQKGIAVKSGERRR